MYCCRLETTPSALLALQPHFTNRTLTALINHSLGSEGRPGSRQTHQFAKDCL